MAPAAALNLAASADLQGQTVEHVVETAKRVAARGGDVVVLIDSLDGLHPHVARKVLASARNLAEGGSLTRDRDRHAPARRREHGDRARRGADQHRASAGARPPAAAAP